MSKTEQFYGTGRRKSAVARVYLRPGKGKIIVNGKDFKNYFQGVLRAFQALQGFTETGTAGHFDAIINVKGGGPSGQIDAIKLGIARALAESNPDFRAILKPHGLLTRDARQVERKKYGRKKARRSPQFSKR